MHSNTQISWLNDVMRTQTLVIMHALNGHRLGAGEMHHPIQEHSQNREQLKTLKVDGFNMATNTVYELTSFKDTIIMDVLSVLSQIK